MMAKGTARHEDREQAREDVNAFRILGGMLLMLALLLYFFHLAEKPVGRHTLGILSGLFGVIGVVLLLVGRRKLRALR
jgi:heme/copper-type cytochrome/quinol oxidase subunit 4